MIDEYAQCHQERVAVFTSMGQLRYLSALQHVDVVIGNSSSGIIEAPLFKVPTVNIGNRQGGRLKAASIVDCEENADSITACIKTVLAPGFAELLPNVESRYGAGDTSEHMLRILKNVAIDELTIKRFHDL